MTRAALILALSLLLSGPASGPARAGGTVLERLAGSWGMEGDLETSCEVNPHDVQVTGSPPHLILTWARPFTDYRDRQSDRAVYDILGEDANSLALRLEGETRRTDGGETVVWILRLAPDGQSYCWGRVDWPLMRCVARHVRCAAEAPSS